MVLVERCGRVNPEKAVPDFTDVLFFEFQFKRQLTGRNEWKVPAISVFTGDCGKAGFNMQPFNLFRMQMNPRFTAI